MAFDFATDNGPACTRCEGTIWTYTLQGARVSAECVSCTMLEVFQPATMPDNAIDMREAHDAMQAVNTPGFDCICGDDHDCRSTGCDENCPACN